jgi:hypothetical protein
MRIQSACQLSGCARGDSSILGRLPAPLSRFAPLCMASTARGAEPVWLVGWLRPTKTRPCFPKGVCAASGWDAADAAFRPA